MVNSITLKLTAMTAIAHQDASPQANNGSNTKPFNRALSKIKADISGVEHDEALFAIEKVASYFSIYPSVSAMLQIATGAELLASFFVSQYPIYFGSRNDGDGEGLFSGVSRYEMLSKKLQDASTFNLRVSGLYQSLTEMLCLSNYYPESQLAIATLPTSIQSAIAVACLKNPQFVVALARQIAEGTRDNNRKQKKNVTEELEIYKPTPKQVEDLSQSKSDSLIMAIPDLSGNSIGHQLRSAIALDMIEYLGIDITTIPTGTAYMLFHGGQRSKGIKTPSDADLLEANIRNLYPIWDALGGCPDAFLMTEGRCKLQAHILCAENNWITDDIAGLTETKSVFEMLDFVTMTRSGETGNSAESGQMIFSHEVLCKGSEAILKLSFVPHTQSKTIGAVLAGIEYWRSREGLFGGKSARNFGRFAIAQLTKELPEESLAVYRSHLDKHKESLIKGFQDGTLGTSKIVCNAGL